MIVVRFFFGFCGGFGFFLDFRNFGVLSDFHCLTLNIEGLGQHLDRSISIMRTKTRGRKGNCSCMHVVLEEVTLIIEIQHFTRRDFVFTLVKVHAPLPRQPNLLIKNTRTTSIKSLNQSNIPSGKITKSIAILRLCC